MELTIDEALQRAVDAHKAGRIQEADRLYTAILKAQPKHPDANHNLGALAISIGKTQKALPFLKIALEAKPTIAQFWLSYIDALLKLDMLVEAKAVLDKAKSMGAQGDGFDKLDQLLKKADRVPLDTNQNATEPKLKQPNILHSLKVDQAIKLAKNKERDGALEEAKRIYQDVLSTFPKNKSAQKGLKGLRYGASNTTAKTLDPSQDQVQSLISLYDQGNFQQALKLAKNLVQQYPKSALLFNFQGAALERLGQFDQSIEAFNKALAIKPDYVEAHYNLGNTLKRYGKLDEAIQAYQKSLAIKPDYAEANYKIGNVHKQLGKMDEAIQAYQKALAIKPNYAEAYINIGVTLQDVGKLEEASEAYQKALAIKPYDAATYHNVSELLKTYTPERDIPYRPFIIDKKI